MSKFINRVKALLGCTSKRRRKDLSPAEQGALLMAESKKYGEFKYPAIPDDRLPMWLKMTPFPDGRAQVGDITFSAERVAEWREAEVYELTSLMLREMGWTNQVRPRVERGVRAILASLSTPAQDKTA